MNTDTNEFKGFCASKEFSMSVKQLWEILPPGHYWNPPEIPFVPRENLISLADKPVKRW